MNKRTANFTTKEKSVFLDILKKYKSIIENKSTSTHISQEKSEAWNKITSEFNSEVDYPRDVKHLKLLYNNLKRKIKKDVAEENKEAYLQAKIAADHDKNERMQTGGGTFKPQLDEVGAQMLALVEEQIQPLPNEFDDAAEYFLDEPKNSQLLPVETVIEFVPIPTTSTCSPEKEDPVVPVPKPKPKTRPIPSRKIKKLNYKELYFKKKYESACFELKSRKTIHYWDMKIRKKQYELLK